jgi:hypothetical protein
MGKLVALLLVVGCGGSDEEVPSCQQAMTGFYGAGCSFFDLTTSPPTPYPLNVAISDCQELNAAVPDRCQSYFDDLMFCLDGVPNDTRCTDCSGEQDRLFGCD